VLICFKVYVEWQKIRTFCNLKNYGFSICIGSTIGWIGWNDFIVAVASFVIEIIGLANITSLIWMLLIT
jgi:hypothetical protein